MRACGRAGALAAVTLLHLPFVAGAVALFSTRPWMASLSNHFTCLLVAILAYTVFFGACFRLSDRRYVDQGARVKKDNSRRFLVVW